MVDHVSIIGAGIGGLTLALRLQKNGIPFDMYDYRSKDQPVVTSSNVALGPNCLALLDGLGVYERLAPLGRPEEGVSMYDESLQLQGSTCLGSKAEFGYPGLRIRRTDLMDQLTKTLIDLGAEPRLHWHSKFSRVIRDDENGVVFELADGTQVTSTFLVGADGIWSHVRRHITTTAAKYIGALGVMACVNGALPTTVGQNPVSIPAAVRTSKGTAVIVSRDVTLEENYCFRIFPGYPEATREGWDQLGADKEKLMQLLRGDRDGWPGFVQTTMDKMDPKSAHIWPFHMMPPLEHWASSSNRVVLVGDAAHAIPPTSGQGAAQAMEDGYSLGSMLIGIEHGLPVGETLDYWQGKRKERIEQVRALGRDQQASLTSDANGKAPWAVDSFKLSLESKRWVYGYRLQDDFDAWVSEREKLQKQN